MLDEFKYGKIFDLFGRTAVGQIIASTLIGAFLGYEMSLKVTPEMDPGTLTMMVGVLMGEHGNRVIHPKTPSSNEGPQLQPATGPYGQIKNINGNPYGSSRE